MQEKYERLVKIKKEIKNRKNDLLACYNTGEVIHKKQVEFHKCQKRNRWVFGGNRSMTSLFSSCTNDTKKQRKICYIDKLIFQH